MGSWSRSPHRALDISLCPIPNLRWDSLGTRTQNPSQESLFGQNPVDVRRPSFLPSKKPISWEPGRRPRKEDAPMAP